MKRFQTLSISLILSLFAYNFSSAQTQTVGLFTYNDSLTWPGYTLMGPTASDDVFLLDNCGEVVHSWDTQVSAGAVVYMLPNGHLMKTEIDTLGRFTRGGRGGLVREYDFNGNLIWDYKYSSQTYQQHHDVEVLPNGNVLILAWVSHDSASSIANGRNPGFIPNGEVWSERILEVRPIYPDSAEIVWEWNLWDHLVQDYDSTKANYGVITDQPRKWDLNYYGDSPAGVDDWIHANAIDYNANLDQIVMSSRVFSEIYIIDHSTTTAEAATDTGGNWGHGGDILYRYGNPAAYDRGTPADQILQGQHDPNWIPDGYPGAGDLMIFNNGQYRRYSSVDVITPPMDGSQNYILNAGQPFGPDSLTWTYEDSANFWSAFISGAERLPNGNTLICSGLQGRVFEVTLQGDVVWDYVQPICATGYLSQGDTIPDNIYGLPGLDNMLFRAYRYHTFYGDLPWLPLASQGPLELNPWPSTCTTPIAVDEPTETELEVYPNPASDIVKVRVSGAELSEVEIYSIMGEKLVSQQLDGDGAVISTANLASGVYLLKAGNVTRRLVVSH